MEFTVNSDAIRDGVAKVRRAVPRSLNNCLLLETRDGCLTIVSLGDGVWAEAEVVCQIAQDGQVVIAALDSIQDILAAYRDDIEFSTQSKLRLNGTMKANINLSSTEADFFVSPLEGGTFRPLPSNIKSILHAAGDPRIDQDNVWFLPEGVMCLRGEAAAWIATEEPMCDRDTALKVSYLSRVPQANGVMVMDERVWLFADNFRAALSTVASNFPTVYKRYFTGEGIEELQHCVVELADLRRVLPAVVALSRSATFLNGLARMVFADGKLLLEALGSELGEGTCEVGAGDFSGTLQKSFGFQPGMLLDIVGKCTGPKLDLYLRSTGSTRRIVVIRDGTAHHALGEVNITYNESQRSPE